MLLAWLVGSALSKQSASFRIQARFAALWPATIGRRLRKLRHEVPWKDLIIEIDTYRGRNAGLVVAEVEFPSQAAARKFQPPSWFGREVTGGKRYSNVKLARE